MSYQQRALKLLSEQASNLQAEIRNLKQCKGTAWEKSKPNDPAGMLWFETYSYCRKELKTRRKDLAAVNALIKFLKTGLANEIRVREAVAYNEGFVDGQDYERFVHKKL